MTTLPPYLKKGDTIGIMCPAGYMERKKTTACVQRLKTWGYKVILGKTVGGSSSHYFSAPDNKRLEELQSMMDNSVIKAILFARGGYGTSKIIDQLDFSGFIKRPKWIIGFSDITALHNHLLSNYKTASLHAPMAGAFLPENTCELSLTSLKQVLSGEPIKYEVSHHPFNMNGRVKGELIGGNLTLLTHIIGTPSDVSAKGKILFVEDVGEYTYNIDRMMTQLKRSGKLGILKGMIVGGFTDMKDTVRPFGKTAEEIIRDIMTPYAIPVAFGFPVSHAKKNAALKIGVPYQLSVTEGGTCLEEWPLSKNNPSLKFTAITNQ